MPQRAGDLAGGVLGVPRLQPRADYSLFEVGDDLAGDAALNVPDFGHFWGSFGPEVLALHGGAQAIRRPVRRASCM